MVVVARAELSSKDGDEDPAGFGFGEGEGKNAEDNVKLSAKDAAKMMKAIDKSSDGKKLNEAAFIDFAKEAFGGINVVQTNLNEDSLQYICKQPGSTTPPLFSPEAADPDKKEKRWSRPRLEGKSKVDGKTTVVGAGSGYESDDEKPPDAKCCASIALGVSRVFWKPKTWCWPNKATQMQTKTVKRRLAEFKLFTKLDKESNHEIHVEDVYNFIQHDSVLQGSEVEDLELKAKMEGFAFGLSRWYSIDCVPRAHRWIDFRTFRRCLHAFDLRDGRNAVTSEAFNPEHDGLAVEYCARLKLSESCLYRWLLGPINDRNLSDARDSLKTDPVHTWVPSNKSLNKDNHSMTEGLALVLAIRSELFQLLDFGSDIYLMFTVIQAGYDCRVDDGTLEAPEGCEHVHHYTLFAMALGVSIFAPYFVAYSSGVQQFLEQGTHGQGTATSTVLLVLYATTLGPVYFILIDILLIARLASNLAFFAFAPVRSPLQKLFGRVFASLGMDDVRLTNYKRQRRMAQLVFETMPQLVLQVLAFSDVIQVANVSENSNGALILALSLSLINALSEMATVYVEAQGLSEPTLSWAMHCLTGCVGYVPYIELILANGQDMTVSIACSMESQTKPLNMTIKSSETVRELKGRTEKELKKATDTGAAKRALFFEGKMLCETDSFLNTGVTNGARLELLPIDTRTDDPSSTHQALLNTKSCLGPRQKKKMIKLKDISSIPCSIPGVTYLTNFKLQINFTFTQSNVEGFIDRMSNIRPSTSDHISNIGLEHNAPRVRLGTSCNGLPLNLVVALLDACKEKVRVDYNNIDWPSLTLQDHCEYDGQQPHWVSDGEKRPSQTAPTVEFMLEQGSTEEGRTVQGKPNSAVKKLQGLKAEHDDRQHLWQANSIVGSRSLLLQCLRTEDVSRETNKGGSLAQYFASCPENGMDHGFLLRKAAIQMLAHGAYPGSFELATCARTGRKRSFALLLKRVCELKELKANGTFSAYTMLTPTGHPFNDHANGKVSALCTTLFADFKMFEHGKRREIKQDMLNKLLQHNVLQGAKSKSEDLIKNVHAGGLLHSRRRYLTADGNPSTKEHTPCECVIIYLTNNATDKEVCEQAPKTLEWLFSKCAEYEEPHEKDEEAELAMARRLFPKGTYMDNSLLRPCVPAASPWRVAWLL